MNFFVDNTSTTPVLVIDGVLPANLYNDLLNSFPIAACLAKAKESKISQGLISCETTYGQFLAETCKGYSETLRYFSSQAFMNLLFSQLKDQIIANHNILNYASRNQKSIENTCISVDDCNNQERLWGWSTDIASSVKNNKIIEGNSIPLKENARFQ